MRYFNRNTNEGLGINTDLKVVSTLGNPSSIVSLDQAKLYLSVTNTQEDVMITSMITNAILTAEKYLNRDILAKQREFYLVEVNEPINLYYSPIASVESVTEDGRTLTLGTEYDILGLEDPSIRFENAPTQKVLISYTTKGIADESIRQGVLALVSYLYDRATYSENKNRWKMFLSPYKTYGFHGTR